MQKVLYYPSPKIIIIINKTKQIQLNIAIVAVFEVVFKGQHLDKSCKNHNHFIRPGVPSSEMIGFDPLEICFFHHKMVLCHIKCL